MREATDTAEGGCSITKYFYKSGKLVSTEAHFANTIADDEGFPTHYQIKSYFSEDITYSYEYTETGEVIKAYLNGMNTDNLKVLDTYASYREKADFVGSLLLNPLQVAITAKIKVVKFDGIDCYSIELKDGQILYFEKETGLLRKLNGQEYYYSFNTVNDKIFELLEETKTQDPLSDIYIVNFTK